MSAVDDALNHFRGQVIDAIGDAAPALVEAAQADAQAQVTDLTTQLAAAGQQVDALTAQTAQDAATIKADGETITALEAQHSSDTATIGDLQRRIAELEAQIPEPPAPTTLLWGSSKGDVGLAEVDRQFGGRAPLVRCFDDAGIPKSWAETDGLPNDDRPVIASSVVDPAHPPADLEAQVAAWLKDAPKGQMVALCHEGDKKVRDRAYTTAQWVAVQERFLAAASAAGMTPVAILTYMSLENGTAESFWSPKMLAVPRVTMAWDTYQPGVPSATPAKMIGKMAPFAAAHGCPFVIGEMGIGLANAPGTTDAQKDQARADAVTLVLQALAKLVVADPRVGFKGGCYWPAGNFLPGPATWKAITAQYPIPS